MLRECLLDLLEWVLEFFVNIWFKRYFREGFFFIELVLWNKDVFRVIWIWKIYRDVDFIIFLFVCVLNGFCKGLSVLGKKCEVGE